MNSLKKDSKINMKGSTVLELVNDMFRVHQTSDSELSIDNSYVIDGRSSPILPHERQQNEAQGICFDNVNEEG